MLQKALSTRTQSSLTLSARQAISWRPRHIQTGPGSQCLLENMQKLKTTGFVSGSFFVAPSEKVTAEENKTLGRIVGLPDLQPHCWVPVLPAAVTF